MSIPTPFPPASSNAPIRFGVVGGNFGAHIARNVVQGNPFIQLAAFCDADEAKAKRLGAELGVTSYSSLEELLADPGVEAVGLFTPPVGRAQLIQKIMRSGRHVMTTKPFELEVTAAQAVLAEAVDRKLAIHLNSPAPVAAEDLRQIHTWMDEFQLGRPVALRAETWANYQEKSDGSWYDNSVECPAAPIFRLGIYFLNDFAALLGTPSRVFVSQARIRTGRPTADNAQLSIEFTNGALANIFASFCIGDGQPWPDRVTINYENGTIFRWVERTGGPSMSYDHAVTELIRPNSPRVRFVTRAGAYAGWYDWQAFHQAIRGLNQIPLINPDSILFGVRLLAAMRRSSLCGAAEKVFQ